ncbi:DUF475 domain-containing protein [Pseudoclavibacter sp. JSM 162008]|uniref:DUF475 domain-containing protein n=1 Tax=Pseudoclavibacter sp. JSM 162008 TaxID=3229855 RepID=UPI0035258073
MIRKLHHVLTVPVILTAVVALVAWEVLGLQIAVAFLFLVVLETTMGAKSAVPMAGVATRIDERSRRIFLTFGLVVGELLGRLLLPEFAVAVEHAREGDTHLWQAFIEVVTNPSAFAADLLHIRPAIAAYGAVFVWLVFAEYLFNTDRADRGSWLGPAEARLARVRRPWLASVSTAVIGATVGAFLVPPHAALIIFACGAAGGASALSILLWASLIAPIPGIVASWVATVIILAALITSLPIWERFVDSLRSRLAAAQERLRA